jgi:hypothetical protein
MHYDLSINTSKGSFTYLRAVSDRYHDIGNHRVRVNYDQFLTAYSYDIDLFAGGRSSAPRLQNISEIARTAILTDLQKLVLSEPNPFIQESTDWQATADIIVKRYSARLKYLALPKISGDDKTLLMALNALLVPYINYDNRSRLDETVRCSTAYLPQTSNLTLAAETLSYVQHYICRVLFIALNSCSINAEPDCIQGLTAPQLINQLIETLAWTTWKECGPCAYDEICFIPVWPYGSKEDHERPSCTNATSMALKSGYWGRGGFGGRRPPPEHDDKVDTS